MSSFIGFIIIGAIAGWLAGLLFKGSGFGLIGDIVVGIIGGWLGGWIAGNILHIAFLPTPFLGGTIGELVIATGGAFLLLVIIKLLKKAF